MEVKREADKKEMKDKQIAELEARIAELKK